MRRRSLNGRTLEGWAGIGAALRYFVAYPTTEYYGDWRSRPRVARGWQLGACTRVQNRQKQNVQKNQQCQNQQCQNQAIWERQVEPSQKITVLEVQSEN